jgi:uroporphyrin-III C-methyltransferase
LPEDATLVVYMPGRDLGRIAGELMAAGLKTATPCCAVSHVATARQSHAACRLVDFAGLVCGPAPLLLLIGRAMESLVSGEVGQAPEGVLALVSAQNLTKTR